MTSWANAADGSEHHRVGPSNVRRTTASLSVDTTANVRGRARSWETDHDQTSEWRTISW